MSSSIAWKASGSYRLNQAFLQLYTALLLLAMPPMHAHRLMMGTRCGDLDPAVAVHLGKQGLSPENIDQLLNKRSGFLGLAGANDLRTVLDSASRGEERASVALQVGMHLAVIRQVCCRPFQPECLQMYLNSASLGPWRQPGVIAA